MLWTVCLDLQLKYDVIYFSEVYPLFFYFQQNILKAAESNLFCWGTILTNFFCSGMFWSDLRL